MSEEAEKRTKTNDDQTEPFRKQTEKIEKTSHTAETGKNSKKSSKQVIEWSSKITKVRIRIRNTKVV